MHRGQSKNVPYPARLPQLTPNLQKILEIIGIFDGVKDFIYFWASYLLDVTDNRPTKQDYQNFAMTIVDTYPVLKGGSNECVNSFLYIRKDVPSFCSILFEFFNLKKVISISNFYFISYCASIILITFIFRKRNNNNINKHLQGIVRTQLSINIWNRRAHLKKKTLKRNSAGKPINKSSKNNAVVIGVQSEK